MTSRYKLLVLTNAVEGQDEAFNQWYDDIHLGDVLKVEGYVAAQRFQSVGVMAGDPLYRYCAIYDVETSDPGAAIKRLLDAAQTPDMPLSEAFHPSFYAVLYQEIGPVVHA